MRNLTLTLLNTSTKCRQIILQRIADLNINDLEAQINKTKIFEYNLDVIIPLDMSDNDILAFGAFIGVIVEQNRNK